MNGQRPRQISAAMMAVLAGCTMAALTMRARPFRPLALPMPQWMDLPAASRYTGLSESFLKRLIGAGRLPAIDRPPRVRRVDLDRVAASTQALREVQEELRKRR
jgi:hypothetical protein